LAYLLLACGEFSFALYRDMAKKDIFVANVNPRFYFIDAYGYEDY
jgi:hypothetical protein